MLVYSEMHLLFLGIALGSIIWCMQTKKNEGKKASIIQGVYVDNAVKFVELIWSLLVYGWTYI